MKKIIAIMLSVVMLLGIGMAAAESAEKVTIGTISINGEFTLQCGLPEGYQVRPLVVDEDLVLALIASEDETKPVMQLSVAYDETYSDVHRMNDLDDEALAILEKTFTDVDPTVEISYGETGLGTQLLIARQTEENYNYIDFLSIYEGYFIEFVLVAPQNAEDKTLSEDELRMCIDFLTELDFVPAGAAGKTVDTAGKTFVVRIEGYNAETNTLKVVLREGDLLSDAEVAAFETGDTITLGGETVQIETIETDEYNDVILNGEIELRKQESGGYRAYEYEAEFLKDIGEMEIPVTETLVYEEQIDPETGELLDENTVLTGADLISRITEESENKGIGFAADNVQITFDEEGNATVVERFYAPWQ